MRIIFFGSDDFAAVCLQELLKSSHEIAGCVTGPDVRQGRGLKLGISPIKEMASGHNIHYLQPETLKDSFTKEKLRNLNADIFVVVAYGRILPQDVLNIPKMFCINVHGSLLPEYRGAAPINWAIINGDKETGVTIQKMVFELDAGDIIAQEKISLSNQITSEELRTNMALAGAKLLVKTLDNIALKKFTCTPQNPALVSYAPKLTKDLGRIEWEKPAVEIDRLIRGLKPWPGTFTEYKNKVLKILEASVVPAVGKPGSIAAITKQGFVVACGQDGILIKKVHMEASKPVSAYDFIQGYRLAEGEQL